MATQPDLEELREPGESELWWDRFCVFVLLGRTRRLVDAVRECYRRHGKTLPPSAEHQSPSRWRVAAKKYRWFDRAAEWDRMCRSIEVAEYLEREARAREHIRQYRDVAAEKLAKHVLTADWDQMDPEQLSRIARQVQEASELLGMADDESSGEAALPIQGYDYRDHAAAVAPGPVGDTDPSGEVQGDRGGSEVGEDDPGRDDRDDSG